MKPWLLFGMMVLVSGIVGYQLWSQGSKIDALNAQLHDASPIDRDGKIVASDRNLARRVRDLESQIVRLRTHLERGDGSRLTQYPAIGSAGLPAATDDGAEEAEEERVFDDAENVVMEALESYNPEIRDRLRAVVQEEQERLREQTREQRRERWAQRDKERLNKLAQDIGLVPSQLASLNEWMDLERNQITEVFQEARKDHSFGEAGEKAEKIRSETNKAVKDLLDDDQFAAYEAMREEEDNRRFGRGFRPSQSSTKKTEN